MEGVSQITWQWFAQLVHEDWGVSLKTHPAFFSQGVSHWKWSGNWVQEELGAFPGVKVHLTYPEAKMQFYWNTILPMISKKLYPVHSQQDAKRWSITHGLAWLDLQWNDWVLQHLDWHAAMYCLWTKRRMKVQTVGALNIEPFHVCAHQKCRVSMDVVNAWKLLICLKERIYVLPFPLKHSNDEE